MVIKANLSLYTGEPPDSEAGGRHQIVGGPIYPIKDVLASLLADEVSVVTRKARTDVANLGLDDESLKILLRNSLRSGRYRNSEWCGIGERGCWAACDAYTFETAEWNDLLGKDMSVEYYVKFAIGRTGLVLLLVSCHL